MTDGDSVAQLAVVILLLVLAVPALSTAHDFAGTPLGYEDETTVDYNSTYEVSENATVEGYSKNVTVRSGDKVLTEGEDYEWNASSGVITWADSANTNDGADATVSYRAYQRTEETAMAWTVIAPLMGLFGIFGLVAAVRTLWSYVAEVWDL